MSKPLKTVAIVAGVVAVAAAMVATAGAAGLVPAAVAATASTIATVASAVSTVAMAGSQALAKPPDQQGTVSEIMIGANMPVPYVMGRTYVGGMQVYDDSANGPDNYDRTQIFVGSAAGPIEGFEGLYADFTLIGFSASTADRIEGVALGFYGADDGYLWVNSRLGARPDTALTPFAGRSAFKDWDSAYKLSGYASWSVTMEFDEEGKRWASGIPQWGVVAKWVKVYDPRKDSTYPGGSGSHRWDNEATFEWSENPALHALNYARGRFVNGVRVVGPGLPPFAIDTEAFVEFANVCTANGWKIGGAVYEAPGSSKWDNLKRICAAGSAEPAWVGGVLTVKFSAPKVALDTITADDLADGDVEVRVMQGWKDRFNTIVPKYRSEDHRWEYVQANAVVNATYLAEDGESKTEEVQYDLVQSVNQAARLAAYDLANRREFSIQLTAKPRMMGYRIGEALRVDIPDEAGLLNQLAVITARTVDPASGAVTLTLVSEDSNKHAWALGQTGVAPPTPTILTPEELDSGTSDLRETTAQTTSLIAGSYMSGMTSSLDSAGAFTISNHSRVYADKTVPITGKVVNTGAAAGAFVVIFCDDPERDGKNPDGSPITFQSAVIPTGGTVGDYLPSSTHPYRHFIVSGTVPSSGSSTGTGGNSGGGYTPPSGGGPYP